MTDNVAKILSIFFLYIYVVELFTSCVVVLLCYSSPLMFSPLRNSETQVEDTTADLMNAKPASKTSGEPESATNKQEETADVVCNQRSLEIDFKCH